MRKKMIDAVEKEIEGIKRWEISEAIVIWVRDFILLIAKVDSESVIIPFCFFACSLFPCNPETKSYKKS